MNWLTAFAASPVEININSNLPGAAVGTGTDAAGAWVANFYTFALLIAGILAFGAIVWGGILYATGRGNSSKESEGKAWITSALLGILLLAGAYVVLNTINPDILSLKLPGLPTVSNLSGGSSGGGGGTPPSNCSDLAAVAQQNNEPYPAKNAPDLDAEVTCIKKRLPTQNLGSQFTYDQSNPSCNYTRGQRTCSATCSHAVGSCHYGGHAGTQGSEAVDFGNEKIGDAIVNAAYMCGAKSARCEDAAGKTVACGLPPADHVHISAGGCDAN